MLSIAEVRARLQDDLDRLAREHDVPGAAVAVAIGDETAEAVTGVVNRRTGIAVTPDAVFQIQSVTKVWTATLIMQLVDEGRIALDDPVRAHLPQFRTADPVASEAITIAHLLTHTGGFEGDLWAATTEDDDALRRLVEDEVPRLPQERAPGAGYSYCSAGMAVLGRLVEVLRGTPFAEALREHLATPLGVEDLAFGPNDALGFNTAIGHVRQDDRGPWPLKAWASMPASNPAAGNRLAMSARGLLSFGRMHAENGGNVLSAASARAMRTGRVAIPASPVVPKQVGLGWEVYGGGAVVGHGGGALGCDAVLFVVPGQRMAIALVSNGGRGKSLMRGLVHPLVEQASGVALSGPDLEPAEAGTALGRCAGVYANSTQRITVAAASGGLDVVSESLGDAALMFERVGLPVEPMKLRLSEVGRGLFHNAGAGYVEFTGADEGPARFLVMGQRLVPRTESADEGDR